jgi:hypothetical protein
VANRAPGDRGRAIVGLRRLWFTGAEIIHVDL